MDKLNTHYYDGKWINEKNRIFALDPIVNKSLTIDVCKMEIKEYIINNNYNKRALSALDKLGAYDKSNNVTSEEILIRTWCKVKTNPESIMIFLEQLVDMLNGFCSQGQTTRLFQILKLFYD